MDRREMEALTYELQALYKNWSKCVKTKNAMANQRRATVALEMGYEPTMPDKARTAYFADADQLIKLIVKQHRCFESGKTPPEIDDEQRAQLDMLDNHLATSVWHMEPLIAVHARHQAVHDRGMGLVAELLPIWGYVQRVMGAERISSRGLGKILGAAIGDETPENAGKIGLERFATPSKLWKFFALHVDDAERGQDASHRRRSVAAYIVADPMQKNGHDYKAVYYARRAHCLRTRPGWRKGHRHTDARSVMAKKLLKYLWIGWRDPDTDRQVANEELWGYGPELLALESGEMKLWYRAQVERLGMGDTERIDTAGDDDEGEDE